MGNEELRKVGKRVLDRFLSSQSTILHHKGSCVLNLLPLASAACVRGLCPRMMPRQYQTACQGLPTVHGMANTLADSLIYLYLHEGPRAVEIRGCHREITLARSAHLRVRLCRRKFTRYLFHVPSYKLVARSAVTAVRISTWSGNTTTRNHTTAWVPRVVPTGP